MTQALPILLFLGSIIVQIAMAVFVWLLLRPMQSKLERLSSKVDTDQERRLGTIEAELKGLRLDHDQQIRLETTLSSMREHLDEKFDEVKLSISRLSDTSQTVNATLVEHAGLLKQHQSRIDGLHRDIKDMRPTYFRAQRTGTTDNGD